MTTTNNLNLHSLAAILYPEYTCTKNYYIDKGYKNAARFSLDRQVEKWEKLISNTEDNYSKL